MIDGLNNTCEGCPLSAILEDDYKKTASVSFLRHEIPAMTGAISQPLLIAIEIDKSAEKISCKSIEKKLPGSPETIPPLGHPDRIAYGRHCLAYLAIKNNGSNS